MAKELPMFYKLGETRTEVQVDNAEENKDMALSLARQARHSIDIFTQDMDAEIYNNKEFEESIVKLARRHPKYQYPHTCTRSLKEPHKMDTAWSGLPRA